MVRNRFVCVALVLAACSSNTANSRPSVTAPSVASDSAVLDANAETPSPADAALADAAATETVAAPVDLTLGELGDPAAANAWITAHGASGTLPEQQCAALQTLGRTSATRNCSSADARTELQEQTLCVRLAELVADAEAIQCTTGVYPAWGHDDVFRAVVVYVVRSGTLHPVWIGFGAFGNSHNPDDAPPVQWVTVAQRQLVMEVFEHENYCAPGFLPGLFRQRQEPAEGSRVGALYVNPRNRALAARDFAVLCRSHGRFAPQR